MPVLTLETIEADAWNAVTYDLPARPEQAVLAGAFRAVRHCIALEYELMLTGAEAWRFGAADKAAQLRPDYVHHKARWEAACARLHAIADLYQQELRAFNAERPFDLEKHQRDREIERASSAIRKIPWLKK
jgi:hypothetical protein